MLEVWVLENDGDIDLYTTREGAIKAFREVLEADDQLSENEIEEAVEEIQKEGELPRLSDLFQASF